MWISKTDLYEDIRELSKKVLNLEAHGASLLAIYSLRHDLEALKKDVECFTHQLAELKKYLEG